jgi:hypothetical protein
MRAPPGGGTLRRMIKLKLTYANVVATLALVLAMTGGAYAAGVLPVNSVETKHLRKGAVTTAKVKDGTLTARDFAPGALPRADAAPGRDGAAGPAGPQGPQGPQGERGPKGDTGARGAAGAKGEAGPAGPAGAAGAIGPKGDKGDTGPAGPAGPKGATGPAGPAGPAGPKGATGPAGPAGPAGPKGDKGDTGAKGATGERGPSDAYEAVAETYPSLPADTWTTVETLNLDPGKYVVTASASVHNSSSNGNTVSADCYLTRGDDMLVGGMNRGLRANAAQSTSMTAALDLPNGATVGLRCIHLGNGDQVWLSSVRINAIRVATITTR